MGVIDVGVNSEEALHDIVADVFKIPGKLLP